MVSLSVKKLLICGRNLRKDMGNQIKQDCSDHKKEYLVFLKEILTLHHILIRPEEPRMSLVLLGLILDVDAISVSVKSILILNYRILIRNKD